MHTYVYTASQQNVKLSDLTSPLAQSKGSHVTNVIGSYVVCILSLSEVQMWELTKYVIPKIKAHWKDLAYCMRYSPKEVKSFRKDAQDMKDCCEELLTHWITTDHAPKPKTYQTLLKHIKEVDGLKTSSETIEKELIEGRMNK